ncbi:MAG: hypothetical protein HKN44_14105 [Ilumatobacter sp.]|nr:hypothetical protein [Ilumatobacter sp.]
MRHLVAVAAAIGLIVVPVSGGPAQAAPPERATMDVAGTYDGHGAVDVRVERNQRRVHVRTSGFQGSAIVACTNQTCTERGLDGSMVAVARDLDIVLDFKGSDEELQAVRGRSQGTAIFTDGFESGDLSSVRGTASCTTASTGERVCDVDLVLRGRVRGPGLSGRLDLVMTGTLTVGNGAAEWGIVDWSGSLDLRAR